MQHGIKNPNVELTNEAVVPFSIQSALQEGRQVARPIKPTHSSTPTNSTPPTNWVAESARITVFFTSGAHLADVSWKSLTGRSPDTRTSNSANQTEQEVGPLPDLPNTNLVLIKYPLRIDLLLRYRPSPQDEIILPDIGQLSENLLFLSLYISKLKILQKNVSRLAVAGNALAGAKDNNSAYGIILSHAKGVHIEEEFDDLILQINRPSKSFVDPSIGINCLTAWQAVRFQTVPILRPHDLPSLPSQSEPYAQCSLDVNTILASRPIAIKKVIPLLNELLSRASSILQGATS